MSKMFDLLSGETSGPVAEAEARAEYSEGVLGAVLAENERLRVALQAARKHIDIEEQPYLAREISALLDFNAAGANEQTSVRAEK